MSTINTSCINCGESVTMNYCQRCGQKKMTRRISFLALGEDFMSRIYGFDGMLPRTLRELSINPGKVAHDYIRGIRIKYVGPVGYYFLTLTIFILIMSLLDINAQDLYRTASPIDTGATKGQEEFQRRFMNIVVENMKIVGFIGVVVLGFMTWLLFRKQGYNVLESMVLPFYIQGHLEWLNILNLFLFYFTGWSFMSWMVLIYLLGYIYAYITFYTLHPIWKIILKVIIAYLVFMLMYVIATIVFLLMNPDLIRMMRTPK